MERVVIALIARYGGQYKDDNIRAPFSTPNCCTHKPQSEALHFTPLPKMVRLQCNKPGGGFFPLLFQRRMGRWSVSNPQKKDRNFFILTETTPALVDGFTPSAAGDWHQQGPSHSRLRKLRFTKPQYAEAAEIYAATSSHNKLRKLRFFCQAITS